MSDLTGIVVSSAFNVNGKKPTFHEPLASDRTKRISLRN